MMPWTIWQQSVFEIKDGRHPLMDKMVNVPLNFRLGESERGIVITGPNTGGKTVAIKTVMLICYMAQCGLHVACKEANISMNSNYLCDIGDGQRITKTKKPPRQAKIANTFQIGDSVMVYPEDYDFSIIFDSVEDRKIHHDMGRKYTQDIIIHEKE